MTAIHAVRAKLSGMIPYSDLVAHVNAKIDLDSFALGDTQPGPGFFNPAKPLDRDTSDIVKCWMDEIKRVHAVWSR